MKTLAAAFISLTIMGAPSLVLAADAGTSEVPRCFTQQQLIDVLKSQGYSDIKLSESQGYHAEISCRTPEDQAGVTRTHSGWNGTAMKDGKQHNVYVDAIGRVTTQD